MSTTQTRKRPRGGFLTAVINAVFGVILDAPGIRLLDDTFEGLKRTRDFRWVSVVWTNALIGSLVFNPTVLGPAFALLSAALVTFTLVNRLSVGRPLASAAPLPWLWNRVEETLTFFGASSFWKLTLASGTAALSAVTFAVLVPAVSSVFATIAMVAAAAAVGLAGWDAVRTVLDFQAVTKSEEQDEVFLEDIAAALSITETALVKGAESGTLRYRTDRDGVRTVIVPLVGRKALAQREAAFRDQIAQHAREWELVPESVTESTFKVREVGDQELLRRAASKASGGLFDTPLAPVAVPVDGGAPGINLSQL